MRHYPNRKILSLILCAILAAAAAAAHAAVPMSDPLHVWIAGGDDPAKLEQWVDERLAAEQASVNKLLAVKGPRTVANTLQAFDEAQNQLDLAGNEAYLMFALGNTAQLRDKAQALNQKVAGARTALSLNRKVYDALAAVPLPANDPATRQYLQRALLKYRLAGVNHDEATRATIRALQDKIAALSLTFSRNVQDSTLTYTATREELDGLPDDFIARHKPGADGLYTLNTDAPDVGPIGTFAKSADLRRRMYIAYGTRAYPANKQVLLDLLATRQQLAGLLGFSSYADLSTADLMTGSAAAVHKLLDEVDAASRDVAK